MVYHKDMQTNKYIPTYYYETQQIIISRDKVYIYRECIRTQLCMEFATIIDQVGIFESNRRKGGMTLGFVNSFSTLKDFGLLLRIYSSSYFDI